MVSEKIPKIKIETPERDPEEKVLSPEEAEELGGEMSGYTSELILEIKRKKAELPTKQGAERDALEIEIAELQTQVDALTNFFEDVKSGNYTEITEKPRK
jgi:hypothetical protein